MSGLLGLVILVLDILAIVKIVQGRQDGTKKAIWIILILLLPVLGLLLWWFLGQKK
jgi:hypothetical protein